MREHMELAVTVINKGISTKAMRTILPLRISEGGIFTIIAVQRSKKLMTQNNCMG